MNETPLISRKESKSSTYVVIREGEEKVGDG